MGNKHRYYPGEDDDIRRGRGGSRHRPRRHSEPSAYASEAGGGFRPSPNQYHQPEASAPTEERTAMPPTETRRPFKKNVQAPRTDRPYTPRPRPEPVVTGEPETVKVKWFNADKGFGFVTDSAGRDLFIHISALKGANIATVVPDDALLVQRGPGRNGQEAVNKVLSLA